MANGGVRRDVPEGVPRKFEYEHESAQTCSLMNILGYGPHIRQARRAAYKAWDRLMTALAHGIHGMTWITTGSKAEGLTSLNESDTDIIGVKPHVICLEDGVDSSFIPGETSIFRSCSRMSYPGHCRLLLERYCKTIPIQVDDALCDDGYGHQLLCSDLFVHLHSNDDPWIGIVQHNRAGPSVPHTTFGVMHRDVVNALDFHCPSILTRWAQRPRNWPTPDVVREVVSLGACVTPVGCKGSDYEHVEWRICFNKGENVLVNNLTDTQVKLYVLLKMVKTDVLKQRKKEITSFTVKNIVLWIAENNPQSLFDERSLLHWLHEGLYALRVVIDTKELPYYMIPERNLMAACTLDHDQQLAWIASINEMMEEGPRVILRLPKIRQAIIAHPEQLRWFSKLKIEMEILMLIERNRRVVDYNISLSRAEHIRMLVIWLTLAQRISMEGGGLLIFAMFKALKIWFM